MHSFGPTKFKTDSIVKSADAFPVSVKFPGTLPSLTSPSTLPTMLSTTIFSASPTPVSGSHSESSSVIPIVNMTSIVIPTGTHTQVPTTVSQGMHTSARSSSSPSATSPSPTSLSASTTVILPKYTTSLPAPEASDIPVPSLGTKHSSVDNRTLPSLVSGFSTQYAKITSEQALNRTSTPADTLEGYSRSPSIGLSASSLSTVIPSQTEHVTESSSISFELYTLVSSVPIPSSSQTPTYASKLTSFTPKPSTEVFRTIAIKMDNTTTSGWTDQGMPQASEHQITASVGRSAYVTESTSERQENVTKTKYVSTEESSLVHSTLSSIQMLPVSEASGKPVSFSEEKDITSSDWSRVPPPKATKPYYSVAKPEQVKITSLHNVTITDTLRSTAKPLATHVLQTETEMVTTEDVEYASFGSMVHTLMPVTSPECTVRACHYFLF